MSEVAVGRDDFPMLPSEALDATLLLAISTDKGVNLLCHGDGAFAIRGKDGRITCADITALDGYPRYLNYLTNPARRRTVESGSPTVVTMNGSLTLFSSPAVEPFCYAFDNELLDCIVLFSDGVKSFVDADRQPVPYQDVIHELMDFKHMTGEFVQRRMQKFLKSAAKRGWTHYDDLSMAAIYLGKEDDEVQD